MRRTWAPVLIDLGCRCTADSRQPDWSVIGLAAAEIEELAERLLVENTGLKRRVANLRRNGKQLQRAYMANAEAALSGRRIVRRYLDNLAAERAAKASAAEPQAAQG